MNSDESENRRQGGDGAVCFSQFRIFRGDGDCSVLWSPFGFLVAYTLTRLNCSAQFRNLSSHSQRAKTSRSIRGDWDDFTDLRLYPRHPTPIGRGTYFAANHATGWCVLLSTVYIQVIRACTDLLAVESTEMEATSEARTGACIVSHVGCLFGSRVRMIPCRW